jgi:hypothetical protein
MYSKVVLLLLGLFIVQNLVAQEGTEVEINSDLVNYYNTELFHWNYNWFTGMKLNFQNQNSSVLFGINKNMAEALKLYPNSNEYYQLYRKKNIIGNIFLWGGFAIAIGGLSSIPYIPEKNFPVVMGVSLGGLVIELIGAFILPSAYEKLFNAVHSYNQHRMSEYK